MRRYGTDVSSHLMRTFVEGVGYCIKVVLLSENEYFAVCPNLSLHIVINRIVTLYPILSIMLSH